MKTYGKVRLQKFASNSKTVMVAFESSDLAKDIVDLDFEKDIPTKRNDLLRKHWKRVHLAAIFLKRYKTEYCCGITRCPGFPLWNLRGYGYDGSRGHRMDKPAQYVLDWRETKAR